MKQLEDLQNSSESTGTEKADSTVVTMTKRAAMLEFSAYFSAKITVFAATGMAISMVSTYTIKVLPKIALSTNSVIIGRTMSLSIV